MFSLLVASFLVVFVGVNLEDILDGVTLAFEFAVRGLSLSLLLLPITNQSNSDIIVTFAG
jgi:hypothetical protein